MCKKYLLPDYFFEDIYGITPEFLGEIGIRAVIADIDNTLVTYDDPEPTPQVLRWIKNLRGAGFAVAFVSNNSPERVERFCAGLDSFYSAGSGKPSGKAYLRAAEVMGIDILDCAAIGDQLFTDVLAAKRLGMKALIVKPIRDKLTPLFMLKRAGEKFIYAINRIKY